MKTEQILTESEGLRDNQPRNERCPKPLNHRFSKLIWTLLVLASGFIGAFGYFGVTYAYRTIADDTSGTLPIIVSIAIAAVLLAAFILLLLVLKRHVPTEDYPWTIRRMLKARKERLARD